MKASDQFVKALENEEVEYIFGIPGEENLDLLESIRHSNIKLILTRHEQAAGFMAATYGRLTGKTGVCLSTLGPGATNFVTAAAYANLGGMPMLMITGQKPILKSKQGRFQIVNIVDMMQPLTKFTRQIINGNQIPSLIREAFRISQLERPGAVHLELPEDIAAQSCTAPLYEVTKPASPHADLSSIEQAVELIHNAKHPLVLIGAGGNRKAISEALRALIDKTDIFFFNTQMGKGVLDEHDKRFLGTAALSDHDYLHCAINRADLIINVGHDVIEKPPFFMQVGEKRKVIHMNFFPANIDEVYFPTLEVIGDISHALQRISDLVQKQKHWDFAYFEKIKQEVDKHIHEGADDPRFPLIPQRLVRDVRHVLPKDGIAALDNGMYKLWFARNFGAFNAKTLLLDNALATMGAGLPSAIAAKIVHPARQVLAICGDGGFMMNSQELETAVRLNLDLVVLVICDNAYGMIKWKQEAMGLPDFGLNYNNPDFVKYAEAYGAKGHRISKTEDFADTLKTCLNSKGVHLIEVPVDYSENARVLTHELLAKTCIL
ncbi:MAG: acetolactate synthase [Gammaproteobacteria bacterium]|jgi:acetolactate synthase-1/2/3 large subunit|nr:acetolactate synthase [Gammaproteobacteria bacterium]